MTQSQRKAIFFGNGLNRINEGYPKWEDLVTKAAERFFESKEGLVVKGVPCPLMYESVYFLKDAKGFDRKSSISSEEMKLKQAIADDVNDVNGQGLDAIYAKLAAAPVSEYITTNIDTNLETALKELDYDVKRSDSSEIRYSIHRYKEFVNSKTKDKKRIWYIHGNAEKPSSIIFGYEQYGGQLAKISSYVNGTYKFGNMHPAKMEERLKNMGDFHISSWIDLFFTADIHIVGFGLDFSEIDIWWLLDKRKRLLQERLFKNRNDLNTSIHFYNLCTQDNEQACALHKLLERFDVDVDVVSENGDNYREFYNSIIDKL